MHCLTGKGRTAALLACLLTWIGEFASPAEALQYIADRKRISVDYLAIPSQQRYVQVCVNQVLMDQWIFEISVLLSSHLDFSIGLLLAYFCKKRVLSQYFSNMLDGVKPRSEHLLLRRVIINSIPNFGSDGVNVGCCPYIQLFKNGKLISTACPTSGNANYSQGGSETTQATDDKMALKFVSTDHGSISFSVDTPVNGQWEDSWNRKFIDIAHEVANTIYHLLHLIFDRGYSFAMQTCRP